jgi:hypothetical protein
VNRYTSTFHTIVECRGNTTPCDSEACLQASGKPSKRASDVTSPPPLTKTKVYLTGLALHVLTSPIDSLFSISSVSLLIYLPTCTGVLLMKVATSLLGNTVESRKWSSFHSMVCYFLFLILRRTKGSCITYSYHYRDSSLIVE